MADTQFIRSRIDKFPRYFYVLVGENWTKTDFSTIKIGDRFFYIEDGKRTAVRIAKTEPFHHPKYNALVVESIAGYAMEQTVTIGDILKKSKASDGIRPVYAHFGNRVLAVDELSIGAHGELFLHVKDTDNDLPYVKYSDDLPASVAENVVEVDFVDGTNVEGLDTTIHRSSAA